MKFDSDRESFKHPSKIFTDLLDIFLDISWKPNLILSLSETVLIVDENKWNIFRDNMCKMSKRPYNKWGANDKHKISVHNNIRCIFESWWELFPEENNIWLDVTFASLLFTNKGFIFLDCFLPIFYWFLSFTFYAMSRSWVTMSL